MLGALGAKHPMSTVGIFGSGDGSICGKGTKSLCFSVQCSCRDTEFHGGSQSPTETLFSVSLCVTLHRRELMRSATPHSKSQNDWYAIPISRFDCVVIRARSSGTTPFGSLNDLVNTGS
jgi:hypothetical protein